MRLTKMNKTKLNNIQDIYDIYTELKKETAKIIQDMVKQIDIRDLTGEIEDAYGWWTNDVEDDYRNGSGGELVFLLNLEIVTSERQGYPGIRYRLKDDRKEAICAWETVGDYEYETLRPETLSLDDLIEIGLFLEDLVHEIQTRKNKKNKNKKKEVAV
jgi:hypothetical protein